MYSYFIFYILYFPFAICIPYFFVTIFLFWHWCRRRRRRRRRYFCVLHMCVWWFFFSLKGGKKKFAFLNMTIQTAFSTTIFTHVSTRAQVLYARTRSQLSFRHLFQQPSEKYVKIKTFLLLIPFSPFSCWNRNETETQNVWGRETLLRSFFRIAIRRYNLLGSRYRKKKPILLLKKKYNNASVNWVEPFVTLCWTWINRGIDFQSVDVENAFEKCREPKWKRQNDGNIGGGNDDDNDEVAKKKIGVQYHDWGAMLAFSRLTLTSFALVRTLRRIIFPFLINH